MSSFHTQDFCSYSVFTNLRYRTIQEHVVILLSNNCAVFVVHFWPVFDITSMPWHEDLIETSVALSVSHSTSVTQKTDDLQRRCSPLPRTHTSLKRAHVCADLQAKSVSWPTHQHTEASSTLRLMIVTISARIKASVSFPVYFEINIGGLFVQRWKENPFILLGNKMQPIVYDSLMKYLLYRV